MNDNNSQDKMFKLRNKIVISSFSILLLTIIGTLSLLIFGEVYGWLSWTDEATVLSQEIIATENDKVRVKSCLCLYYDETISEYKAVDNNSENETISLSEYDNIFTDRNVNNALIIRVELEFTPSEDTKIVFDFSCLKDFLDSSGYVDNYLSNVANITVGYGLKAEGSSTKTKDSYNSIVILSMTQRELGNIYKKIRNSLNDYSEYSFVTKNNNTYTKTKNISVTMNYSDFSPYMNKNSFVFYIKIDYDEDLTNYFVNNSLEQAEKIVLKKDFNTIYIDKLEG